MGELITAWSQFLSSRPRSGKGFPSWTLQNLYFLYQFPGLDDRMGTSLQFGDDTTSLRYMRIAEVATQEGVLGDYPFKAHDILFGIMPLGLCRNEHLPSAAKTNHNFGRNHKALHAIRHGGNLFMLSCFLLGAINIMT